MTITAKFNGTCSACKGTIGVGEQINWERGKGTTHVACPAVPVAAPAPVARPTVSLSALVAFLKAARERGLKFPKTRFAAPGNGELLLSLAGDTSRNPGAVYVKLNGEYAGKVTADGVAYGLDALLPTLRAIEADPAAAGAAYGALTGRCSFCGLGLTDEGSVEVGYGPVCARRYNLPHSPKGSATVVPVVNVTPAPVAAWAQVADAAYDAQFPVAGPHPAHRAAREAQGDCDGTLDWNERAAREAAAAPKPWRLRNRAQTAILDPL